MSDTYEEWAAARGVDFADDDAWREWNRHLIEQDRERHRAVAHNGAEHPDDDPLPFSWNPVDLAPVLAGDYHQPTPDLFHTADRADAILYRGRVNGLHGDSGIGKSWLAYAAVAQVLAAGEHAIVIDYEASVDEVLARLVALGATPDAILAQLTYHHPNDPAAPDVVGMLLAEIRPDTALVVIDSLGEAFGLDGIDENNDADVGPWLRRIARPLADAGPAVLLVDHSTKANDNPLHPSGSKRKRAAITGASYLVTSAKPPTREEAGVLYITTAKDRHGRWARGQVAVTADVTPWPDEGVTVTLHRSAERTSTADARIVVIARKIVRLVRDEGRPLSSREAITRIDVKAGTDLKRAALDYAVGKGALEVTDGPRGAKLHAFAHDLDEPEGRPDD